MKIVGNTVGTTLPKPNLKQTNPNKGDYVKGIDIIPEAVNNALAQAKASGEFDGEKGESGVYVGTGEMPEGYNVQIDTDGDAAPFFEEVKLNTSKNLCNLGTITFERGSGYLNIGTTLEKGKTYTYMKKSIFFIKKLHYFFTKHIFKKY